MKKMMINLVAFAGISLFGMGMVSASPSNDCGDEDVQPITTHSAAKATNTET